MKKLIIPVLISFIALTSCSKALYKDKYDWVKVDRIETKMVKDSLAANNSLSDEMKEEMTTEENTVAANVETISKPEECLSSLVSVPGDSTKGHKTTKSNERKAEKKQAGKVSTGYLTVNINPSFSLRGNSDLTTEEKGYIAAGIAIFILLILAACIGPGFIINGILLIYYGVKILAAAAVIAAMIWFVWWLLFGSVNPGIFFWTMK